jgi:DNA-binding GntR family transcriptional regulator
MYTVVQREEVAVVRGVRTTGVSKPAAQRHLLSVKVFEALKDDILTLRLGPGAVLTEVALAARFRVSRTPVREALALLQTQRLVEPDGLGLMRVAAISVESVRELYELLQGLEGLASALAAARRTEEQMAQIEDAMQHMEAALGEQDAFALWAPADIRLHTLILEAAGNKSLLEMVISTRDQVNRMRIFLSRRAQRMARSTAQHRENVEAIRERDAQRAEQKMRAHLQDFAAELVASLEDYVFISGVTR